MGSHTRARKRVHHQVSAAAASSSIAPSLPLNAPASPILINGPPHEPVSGGYPLHLREMPGDWGQRQVTIDILPDDALLEIFNAYTDEDSCGWPTLVHVCRRWRSVVLASTRRLNLQLRCTYKTPMRKALLFWPALPIVIEDWSLQAPRVKGASNIIVALKHPNRVRRINLTLAPNSVLNRIAAAMKNPLPALTDLRLGGAHSEIMPVLPDSFLGGSAPYLQRLHLDGISFPAMKNLLSSASDLVELCLSHITHSGYISPEAMATNLSALTRLEILQIRFHWESLSLRPRPNQLSPPRSTRTVAVLPALNSFEFEGFNKYLEDLIPHIDAPLLSGLRIKLFAQPIFSTPQLCSFISHAEELRSLSRARITFGRGLVDISLASAGCPSLSMILCQTPNQQVPSLMQAYNSSLPSLFNLERLEICSWQDIRPQGQVNARNTQWLELLRRFTTVKSLYLSKELTPRVVPALQELYGERIMDALPALQSIFLPESLLSGTVEQALMQFLTARQLSGHPVALNPPGQE